MSDETTPTVIDQKPFDYAALDTTTADFVRGQTAFIKKLYRGTIQNIVDIGKSLLDVKEKLDYGQFGEWLEAEFAWKERTAQNYMNVAKNAKFADLDTLPVSALYLIASPTAPDAAVEEIVDRAEAGEKVTVAEVKSTLEEHKDAEQLTHRDTVIRLLVENGGQMHQGILVARSKIHPKIFAGTIQSLLDDNTVIRQGAFYQLAAEATSNDVVALSCDLAEQIVPLVAARADGITYADLRSGLELNQTDHRGLLALRRALDTLLGSQRIQKVGALYRLAESPTAADETSPEAHGEDEPATGDLASRILDALRHGQQWTVPQLQMVFGGSVRKMTLIDTIEALIDAGKLVKLVGSGSVLPRIALVAAETPIEEPASLSEIETTFAPRQAYDFGGGTVCTVEHNPDLNPKWCWTAIFLFFNHVGTQMRCEASGESRLKAYQNARYLYEKLKANVAKLAAEAATEPGPEPETPWAAELNAHTESSDTPAAFILAWLHRADSPLTLPEIAESIFRGTGAHFTVAALSDAMDELVTAGEVLRVSTFDDKGWRQYTLAEKAAVPFKSPDPDPDPEEEADPTPARDGSPERPAKSEHPRPPLSLDMAKSLIHDALRKSQRPLGRGELRKYAGIDDSDRAVAEQAIDVLLVKNVIAEVQQPGVGRRYHYADLVDKMLNDPASAESDHPDDLDTLIENLIMFAVRAEKIQNPPMLDWTAISPERIDKVRMALRQAEDAAAIVIDTIERIWPPADSAVAAAEMAAGA